MGKNKVSLQTATAVQSELEKYASSKRAKSSSWFFKTGKGQYGEGDVFIGVSVPDQRKVAKLATAIALDELQKLLLSKTHEHRLTAVLILVYQLKTTDRASHRSIYSFYLKNTQHINNWDIVDASAEYVVGDYLTNYLQPKNKEVLSRLAHSSLIWERRISIVATFSNLKKGDGNMTYSVAKILLYDEHDLIQKAVGWLLREAGKKVSQSQLEAFLLEDERYKSMSRTMLRYAIERFEETKRKQYLHGKI